LGRYALPYEKKIDKFEGPQPYGKVWLYLCAVEEPKLFALWVPVWL
jgi:hypothetical protein